MLEIIGLVCGVLGALLVTSRISRVRAAGFVAWLIGNAAWVWFAATSGLLYLGVQFGVFWMLSFVGLANNLRGA